MKRMLVFFLSCALIVPLVEAKPGGSRSYGGGSRSSSRSYSSGSSRSSSSRSYSTPSSSSKPSSSKSYSSGSNSNSTSSSKPQNIKFDSGASHAQSQERSKASFTKANNPKPSYKAPSGKTVNVDANAPSAKTVRNLDSDRYATRSERSTKVYNTTVINSHPASYWSHYNDPYDWRFSNLLLTMTIADQAMWYYSHRSHMDSARYEQAMQNAELKARITALESQKAPVNPNYVPPVIEKDPDLMYSDNYVEAVYNPEPVPQRNFWRPTFYIIIFFGFIGGMIWVVFIKNW